MYMYIFYTNSTFCGHKTVLDRQHDFVLECCSTAPVLEAERFHNVTPLLNCDMAPLKLAWEKVEHNAGSFQHSGNNVTLNVSPVECESGKHLLHIWSEGQIKCTFWRFNLVLYQLKYSNWVAIMTVKLAYERPVGDLRWFCWTCGGMGAVVFASDFRLEGWSVHCVVLFP